MNSCNLAIFIQLLNLKSNSILNPLSILNILDPSAPEHNFVQGILKIKFIGKLCHIFFNAVGIIPMNTKPNKNEWPENKTKEAHEEQYLAPKAIQVLSKLRSFEKCQLVTG